MLPSECRIAVLARPGFLGDYVAEGLRRAGFTVAEPVDAADRLDPAEGRCRGAVLDIGVDARELLLAVERLAARSVPFILIGTAKAQLPALLHGRPLLLQPFASYQIVRHLREAGLGAPEPEPRTPELVVPAG